jgi:oxygen-independent coproporphyrinogen-3 oxidase
LATQDICGEAGLPAYELSNHAAAGSESIHNKIYWKYGDYAGIGPGAHGRLTLGGVRYATEAPLGPAAWLSQVLKSGNGDQRRELLSSEDQMVEFLLMGMRLREGVLLDRFMDLKSLTFVNNINGLSEFGLIELDGGRIRATHRGMPILNAVLRELLDS